MTLEDALTTYSRNVIDAIGSKRARAATDAIAAELAPRVAGILTAHATGHVEPEVIVDTMAKMFAETVEQYTKPVDAPMGVQRPAGFNERHGES